MLRFLPRETDLATVTDALFHAIADKMNPTLQKCLGYIATIKVLSTFNGRERFLTKFCDCLMVGAGTSHLTKNLHRSGQRWLRQGLEI